MMRFPLLFDIPYLSDLVVWFSLLTPTFLEIQFKLIGEEGQVVETGKKKIDSLEASIIPNTFINIAFPIKSEVLNLRLGNKIQTCTITWDAGGGFGRQSHRIKMIKN